MLLLLLCAIVPQNNKYRVTFRPANVPLVERSLAELQSEGGFAGSRIAE